MCRSSALRGAPDLHTPRREAPAGPFGARAAAPIGARSPPATASPARASDAGQVLRVGPLELRVLWPHRDPPAPPGAEPNDRATVIHLRDGDVRPPAHGRRRVQRHGRRSTCPRSTRSRSPTTAATTPACPTSCDRLRPHVAVVSAGRRNLYGHPTPATVEALARAVPIVRRTDRDGTVRLRVKDGRMTVLRPP